MFLLGQTVGKYQILSNLGSGGFGTVFLARDAWIDKKVAIKVPHRQGGDFDDLLQEPRLLAALDHPNIVGILTAERVEGVFSRTLPLPFSPDPSQVKADFKNGVLTITVPKPKEVQEKQHRIEVQRDTSAGGGTTSSQQAASSAGGISASRSEHAAASSSTAAPSTADEKVKETAAE